MAFVEKRQKIERTPLNNYPHQVRDGVGNSAISERLNFKHPKEARELLYVMNPIDLDEVKDKSCILKNGLNNPKSLGDQVEWAFKRDSRPTNKQKRAILELQKDVLESIATKPQVRKVNGKNKDLSFQLREKAEEKHNEFKEALKELDRSENGKGRLYLLPLAFIGIIAGTLGINHLFMEISEGGSTNASACIAVDGLSGPFTFEQATQRGIIGGNHMPGPGELGYITEMDISYPTGVMTGSENDWVNMSHNMQRTGQVTGYLRFQNSDGTFSFYCQ